MSELITNSDSATAVPDDSSRNVNHALSLPRCPNCRARLSEDTCCPRCGTDLSQPLEIVHKANILEHAAVAHILDRDWSLARAALVIVQRLHRSEFSRQLLAFVDRQLMISSKTSEDDSLDAEFVVEHDSLASLDLAEIERYG